MERRGKMGDIMLLGVLRMPFKDYGDLTLIQLRQRCYDAADRIEHDAINIKSLKEKVKELDRQNIVLLDCLNGSSKAVYTAEIYDNLRNEHQRLGEALAEIASKPEEIIEIMRKNDIIINDLKDKMQKFAFTVYSHLVNCADIAKVALEQKETP